MRAAERPSDFVTVDVRALGCPNAVLEVKRQTSRLLAGTRVKVICADAWTALDVEVWARRAGHAVERIGSTTVCWAVKVSAPLP